MSRSFLTNVVVFEGRVGGVGTEGAR